MRTKIMLIFGTRPETIKMAPLIREIGKRSRLFEPIVVVTAQHREILDQPLQLFGITPHYDLNIMTKAQSLFSISTKALNGLEKILTDVRPHLVLVQGDTTTTFVGSLAAYYMKIAVGHVEAGLRTNNKYNPFPEEINRQLTTAVAEFHFVPTTTARDSLLKEGIDPEKIFLTGNTVIDALYLILEEECQFSDPKLQELDFEKNKVILLTTHRRESFGKPIQEIMKAVEILIKMNENLVIIFPIHYNPNVREAAVKNLKSLDRIILVEPLDYKQFVHLMARAYLILTDSGGIQEEATALGKPTLILRETTERLEGVKAGTTKLVGTDITRIVQETMALLNDQRHYQKMGRMTTIYGDGTAAPKILDIIEQHLPRLTQHKTSKKDFKIVPPTLDFPGLEFKGKIKNILTVNVEDLGIFNQQEIILDILKTLEFLEEKNTRATFFVYGWLAEQYPELIVTIRERGHEVSAQGYSSVLVYRQTPTQFREDLKRTIDILETIIQAPVLGFRAPSYSIIRESIWAWDILLELGIHYDSSVFPVKHDQYGIPTAPRFPFVVNINKNGGLIEFPLSTIKVLRENISIAGGGYLRYYPYWFVKQGIKSINALEKPAIIYLRTWEMNPQSFNKGNRLLGSFRKTASFDVMRNRITRLVEDFEFVPFCDLIGYSEGARWYDPVN